jgi:hypothetical protein
MLSYWLRFVALLTALCLVPVVIIRAQPYENHDLRAFLLPPEDCPAPCFMGIRPGVTTAREALAILEAHEWVEMVWKDHEAITGISSDSSVAPQAEISWTWQHTAPRWINKNIRGWIGLRRGYVNVMAVDTRLRFGETLLVLGRPDKQAVRIFNGFKERSYRVSAWYLNAGTVISTGGVCPMRQYDLLIPLVFIASFQQIETFDSTGVTC